MKLKNQGFTVNTLSNDFTIVLAHQIYAGHTNSIKQQAAHLTPEQIKEQQKMIRDQLQQARATVNELQSQLKDLQKRSLPDPTIDLTQKLMDATAARKDQDQKIAKLHDEYQYLKDVAADLEMQLDDPAYASHSRDDLADALMNQRHQIKMKFGELKHQYQFLRQAQALEKQTRDELTQATDDFKRQQAEHERQLESIKVQLHQAMLTYNQLQRQFNDWTIVSLMHPVRSTEAREQRAPLVFDNNDHLDVVFAKQVTKTDAINETVTESQIDDQEDHKTVESKMSSANGFTIIFPEM